MAMYSFDCLGREHPKTADRHFVMSVNHKEGKRVDQASCPECGGKAKRDFLGDMATVNMTGATPISHASSGSGSVAKEIEFMAGQFKKNPDGSVDRNHRPFRDTGELNKFMAGQNNLGDPVVKDNGQVLRRNDGSVVRKGAKLFKYGANATPSKHTIRPKSNRTADMWTTAEGVRDGNGRSSVFNGTPIHHSPERRAQ